VSELLEPPERADDRLTGFGVFRGDGVDVAVASTSRDCEAPHAGQNREPVSISLPQEEQWMDASLATEVTD